MILEVTCTSGRRYSFSGVEKVTWDQGLVEFYDDDNTLIGLVYGCEAVSVRDNPKDEAK